MPTNFDFLDHQQPTVATVRALWYLDHFERQGFWKQGFAFERQLRACLLDYSLASVQRIDALLSQIHKLKPSADRFFRQPENQQFYYCVAFYCGELLGRLLKTAPVWRDWQTFIADYPQQEKHFPYGAEYEWVATYAYGDEIIHYLPLTAIWAQLFPDEYADAEPSVFAHILTFVPDISLYDVHEMLPETPTQGLAIDVQAALADTPSELLSYLQVLPPREMYDDDLMTQLYSLPHLYHRGRVVWAALVQGNPALFQHGQVGSHTAEIIYDKSGRTPVSLLKQWADELFALKNTQPEDAALRVYIDHLNAERSHFSGRLPRAVSHMPLCATSILVWRAHLPNGMLTLPVFPILLADDGDEVMILPAHYWTETRFYRDWLREQALINEEEAPKVPRSSQEIVPAWAQYVQTHPEFWQGYQELLVPQSEDLPQLGSNPQHTETILYETDQVFINRLRQHAMSQYQRWQEWQDKPSESTIQECMHHLQNDDAAECSRQAKLYARLRLLDMSQTLLEWVDSVALPPLSHSQLLLKINEVLSQSYLGQQHTAQLIQFLTMQGYAPQQNNTTALLYLSYLYFTGKFVPQSIAEGAAHLRYAADLGDGRANKWLAELILYVPELTDYLMEDEINQAASDLSIHYTNAMAEGKFQYKQDEFLLQQQAFLRHRAVQYELVRQKLLLASRQGNPYALTELRALIAEKKLPERASEPRLEHINLWLTHHFHFVPDTFVLPTLSRASVKPIQAAAPLVEDYEQAVDVWLKWMKWGGGLIVLVLVGIGLWHQLGRQEQSHHVVTEVMVSPAISAAVAELAQSVPFVLPVSDHEVSAAWIEHDVVMIDLIDKNAVAIGQSVAQKVYCSETAFDALRESQAKVQFVVKHGEQNDEVIHLSSSCPQS